MKTKKMKQTSVEWLENELKKLPFVDVIDLFKQAKQMEVEQISQAWNDGNLVGRNGMVLEDYSNGEEYFNKNFKL